MSAAALKDVSPTVAPQMFEADVFGAPVWRLSLDETSCPEMDELAEIVKQAQDEQVALVFCRVPENAPASEQLARAGFRKVERLVTFYRDLPQAADMPEGIGLAGDADADEAVEIGRGTFRFDRYHADLEIADEFADEIKARWVRNGINGRSDAPLVAKIDGEVAGFNLCMRRGEDAVIDLIAVAQAAQGKGIGARLVEGALAHYAGRARGMWVGTQESNPVSIALYRKAGFEPQHVAETWHWTG